MKAGQSTMPEVKITPPQPTPREDGETGSAAKKEAAVLSDASLAALAKELSSQGLVIAMYLNIPTTTLVNFRLDVFDSKTNDEESFKQMLAYWKNMRLTAKDKDKVGDLERALREAGKQDHADVIVDRHKDNLELTTECFPSQ